MFSLRLSHEKKILVFLSHMTSQIERMEPRKIILANFLWITRKRILHIEVKRKTPIVKLVPYIQLVQNNVLEDQLL